MVPAAGQGALALQVRVEDEATSAAVGQLVDLDAMRELTAERVVIALLEASCATPLGVHARVEGAELAIEAFLGLPDGTEWLRDRLEASAAEPSLAGAELAKRLLDAGARDILDRAEAQA
jgi:hydroxymethylbilane synthase